MGPAAGFLLIGAGIVAALLAGSKATGSSSPPSSSGATASGSPASSSMAGTRNYLQANGLTKTAAAGVVGNIWQESSGNPGAPGGGLAQWIGQRWSSLVAFAQAHGLDPNSETAQLQYLVNDLRGPYSSLLAQLNAATTPAEAATLFSNVYERPGDPQLPNRINYANQAYAQ